MMTVTCANCGQDNKAGARFCHACGKPLAQSSEVSNAAVQRTIVIPAAAVHTGAWVTAIGLYLAATAVVCEVTAFMLMTVTAAADLALLETGAGRDGVVLVAAGSSVLSLIGVLCGTAAVGLFRRSLWAPLWTQAAMVVTAITALVSIALSPSATIIISGILSVAIAVWVMLFLAKPGVRAYFGED